MDKFWFKHDYNARNDDKILELRAEFGAAGYGIFWMLIEKMAEAKQGWLEPGFKGGLSLDLNEEKSTVEKVVEFCLEVGLFTKNECGMIVNKRMEEHKLFRETLSKSGRKGGQSSQAKARLEPHSKPRSSKASTDKIRKDINIEFVVFWDLYDKKCGNRERVHKKWNSLTDAERVEIMAFMPGYLKLTPDKQFRQNPERFFKEETWKHGAPVRQMRTRQKIVNDGKPVN